MLILHHLCTKISQYNLHVASRELSMYVGETNPGYQTAEAPNIFKSSVWNLLHITLWHLEFWGGF